MIKSEKKLKGLEKKHAKSIQRIHQSFQSF